MENNRYARRGVSSAKQEVHRAVSHLDKGLFPRAFCRIYPDFLGGDPDQVNIMHADGAGTKSAMAYLYWKETGDISVWRGIAQDAIVMNLDDVLCTGASGEFLFSSTIARSKHRIPGEVIAEIISGTQDFFDRMKEFGIRIKFMGGETADAGDLVRTLIVDGSITCRFPLDQVISNDRIRDGDLVIGLASFGQASYEQAYNSGIGSNGLTSARHDLLDHGYAKKYPETVDPETDPSLVYSGKYLVTDNPGGPANIGQLLLSSTRTYAPVLQEIFARGREPIHGLVHCSGGGQTKCLHYLPEGLSVIKDKLFDPPALFNLIRDCSGASWREMYEVFNMGHRLEIFADPGSADTILRAAEKFSIAARIIGRVEKAEKTSLKLQGSFGELVYSHT